MKKAKVIIPSLALLSFSALACVTGSVAWFSSVTNAHISTSAFAVKAVKGVMDISVYHGVGTRATLAGADADHTITDGSGNVIGYKNSQNIIVKPGQTSGETPVNYDLTHGSYECTTQTAFSSHSSGASGFYKVNDEATKPQTMANETYYQELGKTGLFNIFTWTVEFNYKWDGASGTKNLYFDSTKSFFNAGTAIVADSKDTAKGFRCAIITYGNDGTTVSHWVVISPFQDKTLDLNKTEGVEDKSSYVGLNTSTSVPEIKEYDPDLYGNLIYSSQRDGIHFDTVNVDVTGYSDRKDCIGTFKSSEATSDVSTLKTKIVCWYEGIDKNVEFESAMNSVLCSLDFFVAENSGTHPAA